MSIAGGDAMLRRLERDAVLAAVVLAIAAAGWWPERPGRALGVLGGLALIGIGYAGIRAGVQALAEAPETGRGQARSGFVKFFTRHAMLALGAYVMIARFDLDPVAMLAGVSTPAIAVAVEIVRTVRSRPTGRHSRSS